MLTIFLISTNKRKNSTLQPSGGVEYSVSLKDGCSIDAPTFILNATNINGYNYCYCKNWKKYYWIASRTYEKGVWFISCTCDLLATYKVDILSTNALVTRSSSKYDSFMIDTLPTNNSQPFILHSDASMGLSTDGYVIVAILGNSAQSYFAMSTVMANEVLSKLYTKECFQAHNNLYQTLDNVYAKFFIQASDYIISATWVPIDFGTIDMPIKQIHIGAYNTGINAKSVSSGTIWTNTVTLDIPSHPKAKNKDYLNFAPFAQYTLILPCVGTIPINDRLLSNASKLSIRYTSDTKGALSILIWADNGFTIGSLSGNFGTSFAYGGTSQSWTGALAGAISTGVSLGIGNPLGVTAGIGSVLSALAPTPSFSAGSGGSALSDYYVHLYATFVNQNDVDVAISGKPYGKYAVLKDFTGYVQTHDAHVATTATDIQTEEIENQLNSGIYIE